MLFAKQAGNVGGPTLAEQQNRLERLDRMILERLGLEHEPGQGMRTAMTASHDAFARLMRAAQGWDRQAPPSVRWASSVLCDRQGRSLAVLAAKRFAGKPGDAGAQASGYARQVPVAALCLVNHQEMVRWAWERAA